MSDAPIQLFEGCWIATRDRRVEGPLKRLEIGTTGWLPQTHCWAKLDGIGLRIMGSERDDQGRWSLLPGNPVSGHDAVAVFATVAEAKAHAAAMPREEGFL